MTSDRRMGHQQVRFSYELVFVLNILAALLFVVFARGFIFFDTKNGYAAKTAFKYYFLRAAFRVEAVLHLNRFERLGQEITALVCLSCLAACGWVLLRLLSRLTKQYAFLYKIGTIMMLSVVPAAWTYVFHLATEARSLSDQSASLWSTPIGIIFATDAIGIAVFLSLMKREVRPRIYIIVLLLHYCLWGWIVAETWIQIWRAFYPPQLTPFILLLAFPTCGLLCLLIQKATLDSISHKLSSSLRPTILLLVVCVSLGLLSLLWLSPASASIGNSRDLSSLNITMRRGPCFGPCPIYTLVIHGTGAVEFNGERSIALPGIHASEMSSAQMHQLLTELDRTKFFSLVDRAFERCQDTPTVSIAVSWKGQLKNVISDTYCIGARSSPQANLVNFARELDRIARSDQWIYHKGSSAE